MKDLIINKYTKNLTALFFLLIFIFTRSFMGVYVFGFRIGELAILSSLFLLLAYVIYLRQDEVFNKLKDTNVNKVVYLILLTFLVIALYSKSSFSDPYTYRASSYIWTFGFFFFGYALFERYKLNKYYVNFFILVLIYIYLIAIYDLPYSFQEFILSISDKYEPHKGSDIVIMFITTFFIFNRINTNKRIILEIFIIFSALFLPLLLYKSRAAFISICLYFIIEIFNLRKSIKSTLVRNFVLIFVTIFVGLQSVFLVADSGAIKLSKAEENITYVTQYRVPELNPGEYVNYLFYKNNRFYSTDVNINWRLQIWQDVTHDVSKQNLYFTGYGYKEKIPAMSALDFEGNSVRSGLDGLNENVHNFFINLYARGGLTHVLLFFILFYFLIKKHREETGGYSSLAFILPLMFTSFFDASMENSHFPLIFYFLLGMIFHQKKLFQED